MAAIIVLAVVTLHLLINASALAHAYLDHADPPPGSILAQAPTQLRLVFSERLEPSFSQVHVLNTGRESVDRGGSHSDPDDPLAVLVSLPPGLPDGVYTVAWRTVSADDGHAETGAYTLAFGVAAGAASQAQPQPSEAEFAPETAVARWWLYFAASLMFGPLLTWQIVLRPLLAVSDGPARALAVRRTARLAVVGAVALVAGTLYAAVAQAATASGLPVWGAFGTPLREVLTTGHYAGIWWPRLLMAVIACALLAWRGVEGLAGDLVLAVVPAILLTSSLGSHAAAVPGWSPVAIGADWLHFLAVAAWLGGLASMVFVLPGLARAGNESGAPLIAKSVTRFSNLALGCVIAIVLTGTFQAWLEVGSWQALVQTAYGLSVTAKIGLMALMLAFGAFNLLVLRPRLAMLVVQNAASVHGLASGLGRVVGAELALGAVVLGVAAVLSGLAPGRADLAQRANGHTSPVDTRLGTQGVAARVRITPATVGQNSFAVELPGTDPASVERVQLTLTYLDGDLRSQPLILQPGASTSATWEAVSAALSQPGQWQADLLVRRQAQDDVRSTMRFPVVLPSAAAPTNASATYPPLPSWLMLMLGGAASIVVLVAAGAMLVVRRRRQSQTPLEPDELRELLRGRAPFDNFDADSATRPSGSHQPQSAVRHRGSGD